MKRSLLGVGAICGLVMFAAVSATAAVKPNGVISDGAVLQQGMPLPIWGTAADGEKVTVSFQSQQVSTVAKDGRWLVKLKPLKAGGPFTMTITGNNVVTVKDLLVGEVWVCSGQSNMDWTLGNSANGPAAVAASADSQLRLYKVEAGAPATVWNRSGPKVSGNFSGVAYFFGRDLRQARQVPVGLIQASVGGTAIESWMNRGAFESEPTLRPLLQNANLGSLYSGMIAPLQPYGIRGVIWYQGESNCGNAAQYSTLFPAMIRGWRDTWDEGAFPFLFVQIAPCGSWTPEIREAQLISLQKTTNTAMVVTTDVGEAGNIHPLRKEPVGARLAIAARALAYGEKIEYSGPLFQSFKAEGSRAVLTFTHVGRGLEARHVSSDADRSNVASAGGGDLKGFNLAGADGRSVKATAKIEGEQVVVTSAEVPHPVSVSYGWAPFFEVNLYNKDGLPASPFRASLPSDK